MRARYKRHSHRFTNRIVLVLFFILLANLTVGYSALSTRMTISASVGFRTANDICISALETTSSSWGGYDVYNPSMSATTTTIHAALPALESTIQYTATITNYTSTDKVVSSILVETDTNSIIQMWLEGVSVGTKIPAHSSVSFTITISYPGGLSTIPDNIEKGLVIEYEFSDYEETVKKTLLETMLANEGNLTKTEGLQYDANNKRYYYQGSNVNNYIQFNNELWRIVSVESDGKIKITKDGVLSSAEMRSLENQTPFWQTFFDATQVEEFLSSHTVPFDISGRRPLDPNLESSYCDASNSGCNAFSKGTYHVIQKKELIEQYTDLDSLLKLYLETVYYSNIDATSKQYLNAFTLKAGSVSTEDKDITSVIEYENLTTMTGNIGLLNISDYVLASTDSSCDDKFDDSSCGLNNYLGIEGEEFYLMNGRSGDSERLYTITTSKSTHKISYDVPTTAMSVRPVVALAADVFGTGLGTQESPYILG